MARKRKRETSEGRGRSRTPRARQRNRSTTARCDEFARGMIWGMHVVGTPIEDICGKVDKKDGSAPSKRAVGKVIARKRRYPSWRGENSVAGGRPSTLTKALKKKLWKLVLKERGKAKVTIKYCRKKIRPLRHVHRRVIARALHQAGLRWLSRRRKSWIPREHKVTREAYARWILRQRRRTLQRFAYTDGMTIYLARGPEDAKAKKRGKLGKRVWRLANGKDGLFDENVGPSLYAKAQGLPVKIWGFFANGRLEYHVLPKDGAKKTKHMNTTRYGKLVNKSFALWRKRCFGDNKPVRLVQDHERCLWSDTNLSSLRAAKCHVVERYPKCSPDLNAIEGWWARLRSKLEQTEPEEIEKRPEFLARLRRVVTWLNDNAREEALLLCTNQKVRAKAVLKLRGAKTHW